MASSSDLPMQLAEGQHYQNIISRSLATAASPLGIDKSGSGLGPADSSVPGMRSDVSRKWRHTGTMLCLAGYKGHGMTHSNRVVVALKGIRSM